MEQPKLQKTIWLYYAIGFLNSLSFFGAVLVPFFTNWGHISLFQVQLLQSWYMAWAFLLDVPTGVLADQIGRKYILSLGCFFLAVGSLLYGTLPYFSIFLVSEFILALGFSLLSGAGSAFLYDTLKEAKQEQTSKIYFGRANVIALVALFASSIVGGVIANRFGLNAPFLFSAFPFFLASLIALSLHEPRTHAKKHKQWKDYIGSIKGGYTYLLRHKVLRLLVVDAIIVASATYFVTWFYQPLLEHIGVALAYFGLFNAILIGSQMVASHHFSLFEKLFGSAKGFLRVTAIGTAAAFVLVAVLPNIVTVMLFLLVAGGFGISRYTLMSSYMNTFIPSDSRATVLSAISTFQRLSIAVLNPIMGLIESHSLQTATFVLGLLPLAVFFFSPIEKEMLE